MNTCASNIYSPNKPPKPPLPPPEVQVRQPHPPYGVDLLAWAARIEKGPHEMWICRHGTSWSADGFVVEFRALGKRHRRGHERWVLDQRFKVFVRDDGERILTQALAGNPLFIGFVKWFLKQVGVRLPTLEEIKRGSETENFFEKMIDYMSRKTPDRGELSISAEEAEIFRLTGEDLPYLWSNRNYSQWAEDRKA